MKTKNTKVTKKPASTKIKTTSSKNTVKRGVSAKAKPTAKSSLKMIRAGINMDKTLHSKTKQFAVKNNLSINSLVNTAIKEYINK